MKKHISMILILALLFAAFGPIGVAKADGVDVKITGTTELAALGSTTLKAMVTNNTGTDLAAGCMLKQGTTTVATFEQIPANSPSEETFSYTVSAFGAVTFQLYDPTGTTVLGSATVTFTQKVQSAIMAATFSVSPSNLVASGDIVTFKFVIENQGEATLTDISIKIPGVNSNKPLNSTAFSVAPGKSKTYNEFQYTVTTAATLAPVISYKANGAGDTLTYSPTPVDLTIELRDVSVKFTVDNSSPNSGEPVTFTADVTNNGNVTYSSVTAYINGEGVDFPTTKLAPGAHYSQDYPLSFTASTDVTFMLTLVDHKGETVNVEKTVSISLPIDEDEITNSLTMTVEVDRSSLTSAGTVTFTGHINNATAYSFTQLVVMETTQNKEAYNSALLSSYSPTSFEYQVQVSETTTFNFVLSVTDPDGLTHTGNPVPVEVQIASAPVGTNFESAADVTPSSETDTDAGSGWGIVPIIAIILVVLIIGVGVALLVLWRQQKSGGAVGKATGAKKRPVTSTVKKRKPASRGYHDRNSF